MPQVFIKGAFIGGADGALVLLCSPLAESTPVLSASDCHGMGSDLDFHDANADTKAKYGSGELKKLFSDAGVSASF